MGLHPARPPKPALRVPVLGRMPLYCRPETKLLSRGPHFHFALGPSNSDAGAALNSRSVGSSGSHGHVVVPRAAGEVEAGQDTPVPGDQCPVGPVPSLGYVEAQPGAVCTVVKPARAEAL